MGFLTPTATGELDHLKVFVLQQLAQLRTTVVGLTDDQARSTPSASTLNLTALLLHTGPVAVYWSASAAAGPNPPQLPDGVEDSHTDALVDDPRSLDEVLAFFDRCVAWTAENIDAVADLSAPVPTPPAPWIPKDLTHWEARWCLLHLVEELARHAGHADIIRETIDGLGAFELNDLAEGVRGDAERR